MSTYTRVFSHDPDERLDYAVDWGDWLPAGDAISNSTWIVEPATTPPLDHSGATNSPTRTKVFITGGKDGMRYRVTNEIVTDDGLEASRGFFIEINEQR